MAREKVLIVGGSGLLGLCWAQAIKHSHQVTIGLNKRAISLHGVSSVSIDVSDPESCSRVIQHLRPDVVVNCAALAIVEKCEADPSLAYRMNVDAAGHLAAASSAVNANLIHISTDLLFGDQTAPHSEVDKIAPVNVYGRTKAEGEVRVLDIAPSALVCRTNFYCWGSSYRQSFSDWIINTLKSGERISLFDDVTYTPIYAPVLVEFAMALVKHGQEGICHLGCDAPLSKADFGKLIAERFDLDKKLIDRVPLASKKELTIRPKKLDLSSNKVRTILGRALGTAEEHIELLYQDRSKLNTKEIRAL